MIKNERQYRLTRSQLERFRGVLDELRERPVAKAEELRHQVELAAVDAQVRELTAETGRDDSADLLAIARRVRQPVLQLLGGDSGPIFRRGTRALAAVLPGGVVVELPGQKHAAHHGDPDRFTLEVERFLADPGAKPGSLARGGLPSAP